MQNFPSPFKVLDQVIVHEVVIRVINSLVTFMKVRVYLNLPNPDLLIT